MNGGSEVREEVMRIYPTQPLCALSPRKNAINGKTRVRRLPRAGEVCAYAQPIAIAGRAIPTLLRGITAHGKANDQHSGPEILSRLGNR